MAVSLTKIVNGKPAISDTLLNEQAVKCPQCEQTYRLGYSDGERHRLSTWIGKAETAIRESHRRDDHALPSLGLNW
jgi:hypothetical protein